MSAPDDGPRPCDVEVSPGVRCGRRAGHRGMHINHAATSVPSSRPGSGAPADGPPEDATAEHRSAKELLRLIRLWDNSDADNPPDLTETSSMMLAAFLHGRGVRAHPVEAAGGERPDHWWRQAVIDTARAHGLDAIGFFSEVCGRLHAHGAPPPQQERTE